MGVGQCKMSCHVIIGLIKSNILDKSKTDNDNVQV